jgi:hypothetical protein
MSRRTLAVAFAAALVPLTVWAPAQAKGPDSATVTGPGIGATTITWNRPDRTSLGTLTEATFLWDSEGTAGWTTDPPTGGLGPKFTVTYHIVGLNRRLRGGEIRQDLYPLAEEGPVVYMAPGQRMYDTLSASGWRATDGRMARVLNRLGADLQRSTVRVESAPAVDASPGPADRSNTRWAPVAGGAIVLVLLAGMTFALVRLRSRPRLMGRSGG